MSRRNGDRARFQINRRRKLRHRERIHALLAALAERREGRAATSSGGHGSKEPARRDTRP